MNLRTYGAAPYRIAVVHGGPGAPGEMAPVARELATTFGVLEPLQTAMSVVGQVDELAVEAETLRTSLGDPETPDKNERLAQIACLYFKADNFEPTAADSEVIEIQFDVSQAVSREAGSMRAKGDLLALAEDIRCPVVAIHGDYDPHPADGVNIPLSKALTDFRFILLERCGHYPWYERYARDQFFALLRDEISS